MSLLCEPKVTFESPKYQQLQKQVEHVLSDWKIVSLVMTSLRLDDDLEKGLIPANTSNSIDQVVFEEIIQTALRDFLSEVKDLSLISFLKNKSVNENNLGPFTKCVFIAILKKAYSNAIN